MTCVLMVLQGPGVLSDGKDTRKNSLEHAGKHSYVSYMLKHKEEASFPLTYEQDRADLGVCFVFSEIDSEE